MLSTEAELAAAKARRRASLALLMHCGCTPRTGGGKTRAQNSDARNCARPSADLPRPGPKAATQAGQSLRDSLAAVARAKAAVAARRGAFILVFAPLAHNVCCLLLLFARGPSWGDAAARVAGALTALEVGMLSTTLSAAAALVAGKPWATCWFFAWWYAATCRRVPPPAAPAATLSRLHAFPARWNFEGDGNSYGNWERVSLTPALFRSVSGCVYFAEFTFHPSNCAHGATPSLACARAFMPFHFLLSISWCASALPPRLAFAPEAARCLAFAALAVAMGRAGGDLSFSSAAWALADAALLAGTAPLLLTCLVGDIVETHAAGKLDTCPAWLRGARDALLSASKTAHARLFASTPLIDLRGVILSALRCASTERELNRSRFLLLSPADARPPSLRRCVLLRR